MASTVTGYELTILNVANLIDQASVAVSAGTQYTFSFYAKRGSATDAKYSVFDVTHTADIISSTSYFAQINSSTYTKVAVTFTTPAGCISVNVYPERDNGSTGTLRVAAAQLEIGAASTSWELTTGSAGSKNLLKNSGDFTQATWSTGNITVAASADTFVIDSNPVDCFFITRSGTPYFP